MLQHDAVHRIHRSYITYVVLPFIQIPTHTKMKQVQAVKRNSTLASTPSVKAMRPKAIAAVKVAAAAHHATIIAGRAAALNMKERKQSAAAAAESGDLSDDVDDDV